MQAYMNLELSGMTDKDMPRIAEALGSNQSITSVNLSFCTGLGDAGLAALAVGLKENQSVSVINLSGCRAITDGGAAALLRELCDHRALHSLSFAGVPLVGDGTAREVAEALLPLRKCVIHAVNLSGCRALTDDGLVALGGTIGEALHLETLQLHGCLQLTDAGVAALAEGLAHNSSLRSLDLSWCEEIADGSLLALSDALRTNRGLNTLKLACCVKLTDEGVRAIARSLDENASLTAIDFSWCVRLGEPSVIALAHALLKNRSVSSLKLTGCRCLAVEQVERRESGAPPVHSGGKKYSHASELAALLHRNSKRPKGLAASALGQAAGDDAKPFTPRQGAGAGRGSSRPAYSSWRDNPQANAAQVRRTLRAAIVNGAALYNGEDGEGCLKLFTQTAEAIIAMTRSTAVAGALDKANGKGGVPRTLQERVWLLRCAFDALLEEYSADDDEDQQTKGPPPS